MLSKILSWLRWKAILHWTDIWTFVFLRFLVWSSTRFRGCLCSFGRFLFGLRSKCRLKSCRYIHCRQNPWRVSHWVRNYVMRRRLSLWNLCLKCQGLWKLLCCPRVLFKTWLCHSRYSFLTARSWTGIYMRKWWHYCLNLLQWHRFNFHSRP